MPVRFFKKDVKRECSKCGGPLEERKIGRYRYCNKCHAEHQRLNRMPYSELSDLQKKKSNARAYLNTYVRRGLVKKEPCCICGNENSEGHHTDYSKPLQVAWLCRGCHRELHNNSELTDFMSSVIPPAVKEEKAACPKCGGPHDRGKQAYCRNCHNANMREYRKKQTAELNMLREMFKAQNG